MSKNKRDPILWRLIAGNDSTRDFTANRRPVVYGWTCSPKSRKGDVVVLYSKDPDQSYVAVGRQATDALASRKGRHWAWFQFQPLKQPFPQADVRSLASTQGPGTGLNTPAGGSFNEVPPGRSQDVFLRRLVRGDDRARARLAQWQAGRGSWPFVDPRDLDGSFWGPPDKQELRGERRLAEQIAEGLVKRGKARHMVPDDHLGLGTKHLEVRADFAQGELGRADIVLVSKQHVAPTLLVIEVKLTARPMPARYNPVIQVTDYRDAFREKIPSRWRISRWVIAEDFHASVLSQARAERVPCSTCDENGRKLKTVVLTAPV